MPAEIFLSQNPLIDCLYYVDEINAAVIDIGTMTSRFGTAGQDAPKHVFRSVSETTATTALQELL